MAQLTDDCFAFGGPLLAIEDMERLIAERVIDIVLASAVPAATLLSAAGAG